MLSLQIMNQKYRVEVWCPRCQLITSEISLKPGIQALESVHLIHTRNCLFIIHTDVLNLALAYSFFLFIYLFIFIFFSFFFFLILKSLILTYVPKHETPSNLPPHNISLGHPHAPAQACCILRQT